MRSHSLFLILIAVPSVALAGVTKGKSVEHESCAIAMPEGMTELFKDFDLESKGYSKARYKTQLKHYSGKLVDFSYTVNESALVSKTNDVHQGVPLLQAKLKSLRYSGLPELRLVRNGKPVPSRTETTYTHVGSFIDRQFDVKDADTVHAELVNVLEKAKVKSSDAYWYHLEFEPVHEILVVKTPKFTYRALAQEFLAEHPDLPSDERLPLEIMAGKKVPESKRKTVTEDVLNQYRVALAFKHLQGKQSEEEFFGKWHSVFPSCKVKARPAASYAEDSDSDPGSAGSAE